MKILANGYFENVFDELSIKFNALTKVPEYRLSFIQVDSDYYLHVNMDDYVDKYFIDHYSIIGNHVRPTHHTLKMRLSEKEIERYKLQVPSLQEPEVKKKHCIIL